jgi:hypothetical protein
MFKAIQNNDLATIQYLVTQGADVTVQDNHAVVLASDGGHLTTVQYLVSQGADVTADDNFCCKVG